MKILLILTGGTIACHTQNHIMNVSENSAYEVLRIYQSQNPDSTTEFDVVSPFIVLSENYTADTYNQLSAFLYNTDFSGYDGVIMTHGSDTLSYTSAFVGLLLSNTIQLPFMITASDYPLSDERTNGNSNFSACVKFIELQLCSGIFTVYGQKNNAFVYLATEICEAHPVSDDFSPFSDSIVAHFQHNKLSYLNNSLLQILRNRTATDNFFPEVPVITKDVLLLKTYPNQNFSHYNLDNVAAVLIYLYHSGTACTVGEDYNICAFMKKCQEKKIPVYTASHKEKSDNYAGVSDMDKLTTRKFYNISKECAYTKLLLAYNQTVFSPDDILKTSLYFENLE